MFRKKVSLELIFILVIFLITIGGCKGSYVKKEDLDSVMESSLEDKNALLSKALLTPDFTFETGIKRILSQALSMDGTAMALGSSKMIEIWDLKKKTAKSISAVNKDFSALAFSPDGKMLASGSYQYLDLWKVDGAIHISGIKAHTDRVIAIAFSQGGDLLATGSKGDDKTIRIWETKELRLIKTLKWNYTRAEIIMALTFSNDERFLASASLDKGIKIWDLNSGATIKTLSTNRGTILSLIFSPDGRYLAAGSADGSIMVWDADGLTPVRSISGNGAGTASLLFMGDGSFLGSVGLDKVIRLWDLDNGKMIYEKDMATNVESLSFSLDGLTVATIMQGKGSIFSFPPLPDNLPPRIVLLSPESVRDMAITASKENLQIIGIAQDASGIKEIRINDMTTDVSSPSREEMKRAGLARDVVMFSGEIRLKPGENSIVIKAVDKRGNESQKIAAIRYLTIETGRGYYDKSWGVVIGINNYDRWPGLEYSINDARAMSKKLKETGFDEVIEIMDKDATRERILSLLGTDLPAKVKKNDRVVIFFAGHGQTEDLPSGRQQGYVIPVDASITDYFSTAISMEQVRQLSERIPAKHLFYAIDACYSGLGFTRASGIDPKISGYIEKITASRSVQMITAGGKGEQVVEKGGHGLFTSYLLRGLDGEGDLDNDGIITTTELGAFIRPQVSKASDNRQTPQYGRLDGEGEVVFLYRK